MGRRKYLSAQARKEQKKTIAFARLNNSPISDRKMSLVANLVRGKEVNQALNILTFTNRSASLPLKKLLMSAISNWETKNSDLSIEDSYLIIDSLMVTKGKMLKRIRPAPQGRAHRIRKRSNHVYLSVKDVSGSMDENIENN